MKCEKSTHKKTTPICQHGNYFFKGRLLSCKFIFLHSYIYLKVFRNYSHFHWSHGQIPFSANSMHLPALQKRHCQFNSAFVIKNSNSILNYS